MTKEEALTLALEVLGRASHSLGSFVSDHGWGQEDMDTLDSVMAAEHRIREALARLEQEPLAYSGVKMWVGNQQVVRFLTQTELHFAGKPWLLMELNALKCIVALKEKTA